MFNIRFEEFKICQNRFKSIHFLLEMLPNKFLLSWKFFKFFFTENCNVWHCLNEFIFAFILFLDLWQWDPFFFGSLFLCSVMESISRFVQIQIRVIYNMVFIEIEIIITVKMIMLKNWFWNGFQKLIKLSSFHLI